MTDETKPHVRSPTEGVGPEPEYYRNWRSALDALAVSEAHATGLEAITSIANMRCKEAEERAEKAEQDARDWAASSPRVSELGRERLRREAAEHERDEAIDDQAAAIVDKNSAEIRAESAEKALADSRAEVEELRAALEYVKGWFLRDGYDPAAYDGGPDEDPRTEPFNCLRAALYPGVDVAALATKDESR